MLIDKYLPVFDTTLIAQVKVNAPKAATWTAVRTADLRDPLISLLFAVRELPQRLARWWRGVPPAHHRPVTLASMIAEGPGWTLLDEQAGTEMVVGAVGRFWRRDYGNRPVGREEFSGFDEPGYAKLALSLRVTDNTNGSMLRYEARTATTNLSARRRFGWYWLLIRPGVSLVMHRALVRIKRVAEYEARVSRLREEWNHV